MTAILLEFKSIAQQTCPPENVKKELFDRIFGYTVFYCPNEVKTTPLKNKNIIRRWEVKLIKERRNYYDGANHKKPKLFTYKRKAAAIKSIEFKADRTLVFSGDSTTVKKMKSLVWAFPKDEETIKCYDETGRTDPKSDCNLKGGDMLYTFKCNDDGTCHQYYFCYFIQKITRRKIIIGSVRDKKYPRIKIVMRRA